MEPNRDQIFGAIMDPSLYKIHNTGILPTKKNMVY